MVSGLERQQSTRPSRGEPVLLRIAVALLIVSMPADAAWSQTVTLEAQPSVVEIPPWGRQVEARIVLRNPGPDMLVRPTIVAFTNDSLHVNIDQPTAAGLGRKDSLVWKVGLDQLDQARIPGSVQFEVTYGTAGEAGLQRLYTTVKVQASAPTDKALEASVQGSFDTITEKREGTGYLLVTNSLDVPIQIRRVTILQPGRNGAQAASSSFRNPSVEPNQFTVNERSSAIAEIALRAADAVTPGKQTVVFDVEAEWTNGGHRYTRHLMVNKEVNVGVFFESDLLKALGVPSFLLLPGCLFLFTMQLLLAAGLFGFGQEARVLDLALEVDLQPIGRIVAGDVVIELFRGPALHRAAKLGLGEFDALGAVHFREAAGDDGFGLVIKRAQ